MSKKLVVVPHGVVYWIICRKHKKYKWWNIIDDEFESTHCHLCCKDCGLAEAIGGDFAPICETALDDLYRLILYFRKKGGITVPNPFYKGEKP